jgi:hypothetical protein
VLDASRFTRQARRSTTSSYRAVLSCGSENGRQLHGAMDVDIRLGINHDMLGIMADRSGPLTVCRISSVAFEASSSLGLDCS